ncbi:MAG: hypothetical protein ACXVHY_10925 [Methanobacterium sp.]
MRLTVIKHHEKERNIYNPATFHENEDIIIFPFQEFDRFYNETVQNLNVVKNLIYDSLNPESNTNPLKDLEYMLDWINLLMDDMDLLIKFEVQTTLNSFHNIPGNKKASRRVKELKHLNKEEIQCLIGL